jgi:cephalosporin hydroxylase
MPDIHPDLTALRNQNIPKMASDRAVKEASRNFLKLTEPYQYAYNFDWLGRPIIQLPQDIIAIQEIIWKQKPDIILETGIAHGGSLVLSASILALLDLSDSLSSLSGYSQRRSVIGIDIDIRPHNKTAIECHPLSAYITLVEGNSVDKVVVDHVHSSIPSDSNVLVCLDSNHTHKHVLAELNAYADLVRPGGYIVVWDTSIEFDSSSLWSGRRPWGPGNSPYTAIEEFLATRTDFRRVDGIDDKLVLTVAPGGFLTRII